MKFFGSSGIRGLVNEWLTPELALSIGRAIGSDHNRVILGRDSRASGYMVTAALTAGITSQGGDVSYAGILPTPSLAYAARDYDCGIMVTASHNPAPYNGVKMWNPDGSAFDTEQMTRIESLMEVPPSLAPWQDMGTVSMKHDAIGEHIDQIISMVGDDHSLKVVVDCASGAACEATPLLLRKMGCHVITLNANPDGYFPAHPPEPTEDNLSALKYMVMETGADLGIGHDGDGDRMVGFHKDGTFLGGDALLALFAGTRPKRVVVPLNSSMAIEDIADEVIRTRVGDVYVAEVLKEKNGSFGGEPSGTWIFPEISLAPDAIYAAALLVEMVENRDMDSLLDSVPDYPRYREAIPVHDRGEVMKALKDIYERKYPSENIKTIDGLWLDHGEGWSLVRASGTEPKIRITAEAKDRKRLDDITHEIKTIVKKVIR